jgi:hypothetical protein
MVTANRSLLKIARRFAIRDELLAMRLRGRLVVPQCGIVAKPASKPVNDRPAE